MKICQMFGSMVVVFYFQNFFGCCRLVITMVKPKNKTKQKKKKIQYSLCVNRKENTENNMNGNDASAEKKISFKKNRRDLKAKMGVTLVLHTYIHQASLLLCICLEQKKNEFSCFISFSSFFLHSFIAFFYTFIQCMCVCDNNESLKNNSSLSHTHTNTNSDKDE